MGELDTTNLITFGTISLAIGGLSLAFGNTTGFFLLLAVGIAFYGAAVRSSIRKRNSSRPDQKDGKPKP